MERVEGSKPRPSIVLGHFAGSLLGMVLLFGLSVGVALGATTTTYEYDALGRLKAVISDDDVAEYSYDQAGNRTQTTTATFPGAPSSISVPSSSTSGNYTISWGAATGSVTAYELYQATNSGFSNEVKVYGGTGTSVALSGRGNGTYYYRVRACNTDAACSEYRTGGNATVVTLMPGVPPSITVPSSSTTGNYTISWGTSTGTVTAYQLYEATNSSFTGAQLVYSGTSTSKALSGRSNGTTYYYRVRACNTTAACSAYLTSENATKVTLTPSVPPSITVPSSSTTGNYTISWGASTGTITAYQLYEATNSSFTGAVQVYNGTATSFAVSGRGSGTYYYRVRACNTTAACSGYRTGTNAVSVNVPIQVLSPTIQVTTTGMTTSINTFANLNGNPATIHSFSLSSCPNTTAQILSGAQSIKWTNNNYYYWQCEPPQSAQCSASFVIRNSNNGQLHNGSATVVVKWQPQSLQPGMQCP